MDLSKFKVISIAKEDKDYKCELCKSNRGFLGYFDTCGSNRSEPMVLLLPSISHEYTTVEDLGRE